MRYILVVLWLTLVPAWADEAALVAMLRLLFQQPRAIWGQTLQQNRALLDGEFFMGVEQRLLWDEQLGQWEDAVRFATVGDLGCQIVGRAPRYSAGLRASLERRGLEALDFGMETGLVEAGPAAPWFAPVPLLRPEPEKSAKSLRRAKVEWARGNRDVALRYFRDAAVQDPHSAAAHLLLGVACAENGQTGQAIGELERAVAIAPQNKDAWLELGRNYERQFDDTASITDWDLAERAFRNAEASLELRRLAGKQERCRAESLALAEAGDWTLWIPGRRDRYGLASYVGNRNDDDEDQFLDLEPTQASGALVWRGTRGGALVWVRSRQADTRLLRGGRFVLNLGCSIEKAWGKPAASFVHSRRKCRLLIYLGPTQDIGLEIERGKVSELILMEKGRLLKEMRELRDWRSS